MSKPPAPIQYDALTGKPMKPKRPMTPAQRAMAKKRPSKAALKALERGRGEGFMS